MPGLRLTLLGDWVAIEPIEARLVAGGIITPWTARAPEAFPAVVLAVGPRVTAVEVGDYVLVEQMSGHPHMAGPGPDVIIAGERQPGRTVVTDLRASDFGSGSATKAGIVRQSALMPPHNDEEIERRMLRCASLLASIKGGKSHLDDPDTPHMKREISAHRVWLARNEVRRAHGRRSRAMIPSQDPGLGDGVVALFEDAAELLAVGVDELWLARRLGIGNDHVQDSDGR